MTKGTGKMYKPHLDNVSTGNCHTVFFPRYAAYVSDELAAVMQVNATDICCITELRLDSDVPTKVVQIEEFVIGEIDQMYANLAER
jgi:hypothetical protein